MTRSMRDVSTLVDAFVEHINREPREPERLEDVPAFLRDDTPDNVSDGPDGWTCWRIMRRDNSLRSQELQRRIEHALPPSFQYFLATYSFPAFDAGPLTFFANTGEDIYWELGRKLFQDPKMSPQLLRARFIQIGNPFIPNYDPICFEYSSPGLEKRIVQLDHGDILRRGEMNMVGTIAESFIALVHDLVRGERRS